MCADWADKNQRNNIVFIDDLIDFAIQQVNAALDEAAEIADYYRPTVASEIRACKIP